MANVKPLPGWESAIFSVVGHLLNSSALDPQTKSGLNDTLNGAFSVADEAPQLAGGVAAEAVGLGATALEAAVPAAAPVVAAVEPMGEAMVADIVQGIVGGLAGIFERHNQNTLDAIKSLRAAPNQDA